MVQFGLLAGLVGLIFSFMLFFAKLHYEQSMTNTIIGILILFAVIGVAIFQYRKNSGGFLTLGQALKLGTGIAVVSGIIGLVFYALLTNDVLEAGYMEKATEIAKQKTFAENPNLTQEQWDQGMEMQNKFKFLAYPFILIFNAIAGLVSGLVFGLILQKKPSEY